MFNGKPKYNWRVLAREIMQIKNEGYVDHINHDTLDNRKQNLRITKGYQNTKNRKSKNKNNTTGYRNVTYDKNTDKYIVQLIINGKNTRLKEFDDVHKAGKYAQRKRIELYGRYAGKG